MKYACSSRSGSDVHVAGGIHTMARNTRVHTIPFTAGSGHPDDHVWPCQLKQLSYLISKVKLLLLTAHISQHVAINTEVQPHTREMPETAPFRDEGFIVVA